ncbi:Virulence factor VirK [Moritella sp. JT01]|nr:Virulence factor VirK [Moritella sp. JT01]
MNIISMAIEANNNKDKGKIKTIIKFIIRALVYYPYVKKMHDNFANNERKMLLKKQPAFLFKCVTPYLSNGFSKKEVVDTLIQHYNWFEDKFSADARHQVYNDALTIYRLEINEKQYFINLSFERSSRKEGELTLTLTDTENTNYYVLAFTVMNNDIYIGRIQGGSSDNGFSRLFTKTLYGLRPKSFMIETLRLLAVNLDIKHIYAIQNSAHVLVSKRYSRTLYLDYNSLWEEHNGEPHNDYFYKLPLKAERKNIEDIKRTKRKMYSERYDWLDNYDKALKNNLNDICN